MSSDWKFTFIYLLFFVIYFDERKRILKRNFLKRGSCCCSVGRAVASDTIGPRFESSHCQTLFKLYSVSCVEKTTIKKKRHRRTDTQTNHRCTIYRYGGIFLTCFYTSSLKEWARFARSLHFIKYKEKEDGNDPIKQWRRKVDVIVVITYSE